MKSRIAVSLAIFAVALSAASVALGLLGARPSSASSDWGSGGIVGLLVIPIGLLPVAVVGGLIASRRPENPVGWLLLASGLSWSWIAFVESYAVYGLRARPGSLPGALHLGATSLGLWVPAVGLPATLLLQVFPDGRPLSHRWRTFSWFTGIVLVLAFLGIAVEPSKVASLPDTANPYALPSLRPVVLAGSYVVVLFPVCVVVSVICLVLRYRRSGSRQREQIKWLASAGAIVGAILGAATLFSGLTERSDGTYPLAVTMLQNGVLVSFALIPVAVGFAVLRYRLYDIDRIISRTVSYAAITAFLGGLFAALVLVPTAVVGSGGRAPDWLIAVATLVVAALFRPVRRRVQYDVDRRFNRGRYDAAKTIDEFASRLRDEVDITTLKADLETVVQQTMHPAHVSLWLKRNATPG